MDDFLRTNNDDYAVALDQMEDGEYELALPLLNRLVSFEPQNHEFFAALLEANLGLERYRKVIELADAGIAEGRPRAALELHKAFAYERLEQPEQAEAATRAALDAGLSPALGVGLLARLMLAQQRGDEAFDLCQRFAMQDPEDADLAFRVIAVAKELHRDEVVIDAARSYLKRFGKEPSVLSFLGNAYVDLKDYRRADRAFRDAAALEPDVADHHFNVVMAAYFAGNDAAGEAYLDRLASRTPELADQVNEAIEELLDEIAEADDTPV